MELRVAGETVTVTMRTTGNDFELAVGYCLAEGLQEATEDLESIRYCSGVDAQGHNTYNVVEVSRRGGAVPASLRRDGLTSSACGLCGTTSLADVRRRTGDVSADAVRIPPEVLAGLPEALRTSQDVFDRTGGLHAAGLFDAAGTLLCLREDVGRHNAVDKVVGWAALQGRLPLRGHVLMVSGRVAFEIVQKALVAGIPIVAAVSAPSSLAVDMAAQAGLTLVGFLRGERMNVYAGAHRLLA